MKRKDRALLALLVMMLAHASDETKAALRLLSKPK
jgi:hypothetical protein